MRSNWSQIGDRFDLLKPADALRMLRETRVDAVSIARGALGNPWFFRQAADLAAGRPPYQPGIDEQRLLLEEHFAHCLELYGRTVMKHMLKYGIKYSRMHPTPARVRNAFAQMHGVAQWQAVLDEFYRQAEPAVS